jgi:uncharacterized OsmC-like protein
MNVSTAVATEPAPFSSVFNGVDTDALLGTIEAFEASPGLARFTFRARNRWLGGAHSRTTIRDFHAAGHDDASRAADFVVDAGEPSILQGSDTGPSPAEHLLHALGASLTTSLVFVAATRGVRLTEVESTLEADLDVRGALGLTGVHRRGFSAIRISLRIRGDASERELRGIAALARRRSAVLELVTNGVRVDVEVET